MSARNLKAFWPWLAVFAGMALVVYLPAHGAGWFLDDRVNLVDNPLLADPLAALTGHRGLSFFSFAIDYSLWGSNPTWSRWVNVAIHLLNSLLVMTLVRRLAGVGPRWAALLGLLFLCHPVQTATVNYIVQRMALLSACFALLSVLWLDHYFRMLEQERRRAALLSCGLSICCGILSMMAKENTALLPLAVPLVAWLRGRGRLAPGWPPVLAFWGVLLAGVLIFKQGLSLNPVAVYYQDTGEGLYRDFLDDRSWLPLRYFLSQLEVFWIYLGLLALPLWQGFDYGWPIPPLAFSPWHLLTILSILAVWLLAFRQRKRFPLTFFGLLWVALFMAIESSFVPLDPIFLHRLYLAMVGIVLIFYEQVLARLREPRGQLCAVMVVVLWTGLAAYRSHTWRDPVTFWAASARVADRGLRSNLFLAEALFEQGRYAEAAELLRRRTAGGAVPPNRALLGEALFFAGKRGEAFTEFRAVAALDPSYSNAELFEAFQSIEESRLDDAENWLKLAERRNSHTVFGLYLRGRLAEQRQQPVAAAQFYRKAVEYQTRFAMLNFDPAYAVWAKARLQELQPGLAQILAREQAAVGASPKDLNRRGELANLLITLGEVDAAIEEYRKLKAMAPPAWILPYNLGIAYEKRRDYPLALQSYREGLAMQPDQPLLLYNYALLEKRSGRFAPAREALERLLRITPDDGRVWVTYADLLHATGHREEALQAITRATRLPGSQQLANQLLLRIRYGR